MTIKSTTTYTAKSLEDIAEHFDELARISYSCGTSYSRKRRGQQSFGEARAWKDAATFLRIVKLDPNMSAEEDE